MKNLFEGKIQGPSMALWKIAFPEPRCSNEEVLIYLVNSQSEVIKLNFSGIPTDSHQVDCDLKFRRIGRRFRGYLA